MHLLETKIAACLRDTLSVAGDARVVAGVSGGPDSVALLRGLCAGRRTLRTQWTIHVVHVNHLLRGEAGNGDALFVESLCRELDVPCHVEQRDVTRVAQRANLGIEAAGRRARYACFHEWAKKLGAVAVLLGHHADDNAETVLHRILRGTGLRGLAGIPRARPIEPGSPIIVARPMLDVPRSEIEAYLAYIGQPYRVDATNADTTFQRNWLRHKILPAIEKEYGAEARGALARLAQTAADLTASLDAQAEAAWPDVCVRCDANSIEFDAAALAALPTSLWEPVLRRAWRALDLGEKGLDAKSWQGMFGLIRSGSGRTSLPCAAVAECRGGRFVLRRGEAAPLEATPLEVPGESRLHDIGACIRAEAAGSECPLSRSPDEELVDADALALPLVVRFREPGDVFHPLGAPGKRKLKDFFIDAKVPQWRRDRVPLVVDQEGIVWVVGFRIDDRVKVTPQTQRKTRLSVREMS